MKLKKLLPIVFLIPSLFIFISCSTSNKSQDRVVIALVGDVSTFNPMYTMNYHEGIVSELIYLGLVDHKWNKQEGKLESFPLLAESWQWNKDSTSIMLNLRDDVYWHDSTKFTAEDVVYTFDLYSDPATDNRFFGIFENYYLNDDLSINIDKSFEIVSDYELKINFRPGSNPGYFDFDLPILPKHIFEKVGRKELINADLNFNPVGTGPYKLQTWHRNESIVLALDRNSFLYNEDEIDQIIFKIVPDYNSRILQLQKGEIDLMQGARVESIELLQADKNLAIDRVRGREFDYIGWNNINPELYSSKKEIKPNKFFGDKRVRQAMTYAINRQQIVDEFLEEYGKVASGPIAPMFKQYVSEEIHPHQFNPQKAKELLNEAGWTDSNGDRVLDKNNNKFSFTLNYPTGNPLREFAANIIKNDLLEIGVIADIQPLEVSVFFDKMYGRAMDAWIAGWIVPIPVELKPYWYSNLNESFANVVSFRNKEADKYLDLMKSKLSPEKLKEVYLNFQKILYDEQPVTFLYWIDNIVAYNTDIKNISITPLGAVHHCWEWRLAD